MTRSGFITRTIWVAAFGLAAGTASAGTATCPDSGGTNIFTVTTSSGLLDETCWDWAFSGNPVSGTAVENPGDLATKPAADGTGDQALQLPYGFSSGNALLEFSGSGLYGTQSGVTLTSDGEYSGKFYFSPPQLTQDVIITFKVGNNEIATWGAFRLFAGFVSSMTDTWTISGTSRGELSNFRLWTGDGTDEFLVPIPAAAWLLGSGLLGLFAVGRRRKVGQVAAA